MLDGIRHSLRLIRTLRVLARYDALVPAEAAGQIPLAVRLAGKLARLLPSGAKQNGREGELLTPGGRLAAALASLGPSHIKLGQFLATRPDMIGARLAGDLKQLQDRLPPFAMSQAIAAIETELGQPVGAVFTDLGPPVAAASIAQVHKAKVTQTKDGATEERTVAVKILRPGIEKDFAKDLAAFAWAARLAERLQPQLKRLEPVRLIETLRASVEIEMDLRLEAAAASELAELNAGRTDFRVPEVDWTRTSARVLTTEWIDAIPLNDREALEAAGQDLAGLARIVVQTFLHQALDDGFFHADMHQGNLFADSDGRLVAVDFGIMGRLDRDTRRYFAEILFGFLMRDYHRLAEIHFEAGYVAKSKSKEAFAQAMRSIGEPIFGRNASEISMARLLTQLFQTTEVFDMHLQPQLILLQKTMVVVEGVARDLDPDLNIWEIAKPVVEDWMRGSLSPEARLREIAGDALTLGATLRKLPETLKNAESVAAMMSAEGLKLHPETARAIAQADPNHSLPLRLAAWVAALALVVIALSAIA